MTTIKKLYETWRVATVTFGEGSLEAEAARAAYVQRQRKNALRRARHQAMTDLGVVRVKGGLGRTYYE